MKKMNLISLWGILIFFSIVICVLAINTVQKTNIENKLYKNQISFLESYVSKKSSSEDTIKLLNELSKYIDKYNSEDNIIPNISFLGKDNDNYLILYTKNDNNQVSNYKSDIENIISKIKKDDFFYIVAEYEENNEYINKIVIEYLPNS